MGDSMELMAKPQPAMSDEALPFWQGARRGELMIQRCPACGAYQFPPRARCAHCWEAEPQWVTASGKGTVYSFSVIHRPPTPAFQADTPYVLALVDLAEGPRLMCNIVECDPDTVRIGMAVEVVFESRGDDVVIPQFRLAP